MAVRLVSLVPTLLSLAILAVAGLLSLHALEGGAAAKPPAGAVQPPVFGVAPAAMASRPEVSTVMIVVDSEALVESMSRIRAVAGYRSAAALEFMVFRFDSPDSGAEGGLLVEAIRELMQLDADFQVVDLRVSGSEPLRR